MRSRNKKGTNAAKWTPSAKQIAIADLLLNPEDRRSKTEKMEAVGVSRKTFYRWMKDERFLGYLNGQLDRYTSGELADVWRALIMQCKRGNVPAIRLFFEMKNLHPSVKEKW